MVGGIPFVPSKWNFCGAIDAQDGRGLVVDCHLLDDDAVLLDLRAFQKLFEFE